MGHTEVTALPLVPLEFRQRAFLAVAADDSNATASLASGGGSQTQGRLAEESVWLHPGWRNEQPASQPF